MLALALEVSLGPALVAAATLAARRWGQRIGGWLSALPVIAGPVLLADAHQHGDVFAARAAAGTLVGLVGLAAFVVAYGRLAPVAGWRWSLAGGWLAFAAVAAALGGADLPAAGAAAAAAAALIAAHALLPRGAAHPEPAAARPHEALVRAAATLALVVVLTAAAGALGPAVGGVLIAVPVLASVLATFTHARAGGRAATALLRGMVEGMAGFATFCAVVAGLLPRLGTAGAFSLAVVVALAVNALTAGALTLRASRAVC